MVVTPFVGVWIETSILPYLTTYRTVTPFVGVWIETLGLIMVVGGAKVTPFVGVWIETLNATLPLAAAACHTLRGCVDWNHRASLQKDFREVTPFVGVWIETEPRPQAAAVEVSHPSWVCGLKLAPRASVHKQKSHTLRGCVDWNR